ncbi:protein JINGUBANG-like [Actinidia eriantha]|uniref:protein JINGUBANG-like n=1 Tax=Actinidia eriantha TaxID=165200 RepID=UPI00258BFA6E|nr:protein JINGUBANG-like [Actinidia eriantha]
MQPHQTHCSHNDPDSHSNHLHHHHPAHHQCIATLKSHSAYTSSLALDGKFLYTGSSHNEIRLWKHNSLSSEPNLSHPADTTVAAGNGAVKSLVTSSNKLFSAHQDSKIRVWKIVEHLAGSHNYKLAKLATLPTLSDRAMKLLTPNTHVQIRRHKKSTWVHHVDVVSALTLSKDRSLLYSVSWDRTLKIWRTTDFKCLESIKNAHDDAINAVESSIDGHVYTGSADKMIKVWRKSPGEKKHSLISILEKHNSGVNALALSGDGSVLFSGAGDRSVVVWKKDSGGGGRMVVVVSLRGHGKAVLCLAVAGDLVCSGSADSTVRVWRGCGGGGGYWCLAVLEGHGGPVKCLAVVARDDYGSGDEEASSYLLYSPFGGRR